MKTGIIFDLDGTLLDSLEDIYLCTNHILRRYGCPERSREEIRHFVGYGARHLVEKALPGKENDPPLDQTLADYMAYYQANCNVGNTRAYPGIPEALNEIREKYPVAIVSNKPHDAVVALSRDFFGEIYALGQGPDCPRKPAPDMVYRAMAALGVDRGIYVGDSEVDIQTAKAAGLPCLSVLWGFRDKKTLEAAGGAYFCEKAEDMLPMLETMLHTCW